MLSRRDVLITASATGAAAVLRPWTTVLAPASTRVNFDVPDNRLVVDSLEAEWNGKLRTLTETQQNCERQREQDRKVLSDQQRAAILSLATDFPRLWRDPNTPDRERKRMIRLLLEDVTLVRGEDITLHIRFKGGAIKTLMVPAPLNAWQQRATDPAVVKEIDQLLDYHTYLQIASILNERDLRSGEGQLFSVRIVARIQKRYGLMPRYDRLRKARMLTVKEMAVLLGITPHASRYGIAMDCYAVTPATTKATIRMNIQVTTRHEKPKA